MSLFIPYIFEKFSREYVATVFEQFGTVHRVDLVSKVNETGKTYNSAYIHFEKWNTDPDTEQFKQDLAENSAARIKYEKGQPWYWTVLPNKKKMLPMVPPTTESVKKRMKTPPPLPQSILNIYIPIAKESRSYKNAVVNRYSPRSPVEPPPPIKQKEEVHLAEYLENEDPEIARHTSSRDIDDLDDESILDEIEAAIDKETSYFITIDSRYVRAIEEENAFLHKQLNYFQTEYNFLHNTKSK